MNAPAPFWQLLFAPEAATPPPQSVAMKLLTRRGQPFLLLPAPARLAARGLELYPAQTPRGRLLRTLARLTLRAGLPFGIRPVTVTLSGEDPFIRWLADHAAAAPGGVPQFAVLAGNPASPGQRLILLLFDPAGQPVAVAKAGVTDAARKLIDQEQQFLESVPGGTTGIPPLRGKFASPKVRALALDFFPGHSPRAADEPRLPQVLGNWLRPAQPVAFTDTRPWHELSAACTGHPIFKSLATALPGHSSASAICHGDFAPWNVRVSPDGDWLTLDWERGDLHGLPGWDWFHYVLQKAILVQREPVTSLAGDLEALFANDAFRAYARTAGILGHERALVLFYLLHHAEVIRPGEGLTVTHELIAHLAAR